MPKILVVGQTPPPYSGQAVMMEKLLDGDYGEIELCHVRMAFSGEMDEIGKFRFKKLIELLRVIKEIIKVRFTEGVEVLCYPPAGENIVPVLRDLAILTLTRHLFRKTVFYFHAGGVAEVYARLPFLLRLLYRIAYMRPDAAIRVSEFAPEDSKKLKARKEYVVYNGIEDQYEPVLQGIPKHEAAPVAILFVGVISEAKGVLTLLQACNLLVQEGKSFCVHIVGKFESKKFERAVRAFVAQHDLDKYVAFPGVLTGCDKYNAYAAADIFCLPSQFETFGLVIVEALSFSLPVVATQVGGVPAVVEDGVCGFLTPPNDAAILADRLRLLMDDAALRNQIGQRGRRRYLEKFTICTFYENMKHVFHEIIAA